MGTLPPMRPSKVLLNYYEPHSQGLTWHRDNSTSERKSAQKGRPVLSVSIGDSCDFGYKAQYDDEDQFVKLDSGDVLVFGGPARLIVHAVTRVSPGTAPAGLSLPRPG